MKNRNILQNSTALFHLSFTIICNPRRLAHYAFGNSIKIHHNAIASITRHRYAYASLRILQHHTASLRIAAHVGASRRIAAHRDASHRIPYSIIQSVAAPPTIDQEPGGMLCLWPSGTLIVTGPCPCMFCATRR